MATHRPPSATVSWFPIVPSLGLASATGATAGALLAFSLPALPSRPLALRTRAPILVDETVIENAKTVDFGSERMDTDKVQRWLEALDPAELPKYKM